MKAGASVFFSFVLATLPVGAALAQTPTTTVRWQAGTPDSDLIVRNGLEIAILDHEGLSVRVTLTVQDNRQIALVGVINQTTQRVEVIPSQFALDLVRPEEKSFRYQDPDMLAAKARNSAAWAEVLAAMLSYQRSYTTGSIYGTTFHSTTTTYPNVSSPALAAAGQAKEVEASTIERGALRENTLLPGEDVSGRVFFNAPKHYGKDYGTGKLESVLKVPVGDYVFEFPFYWDGWATAGHVTTLFSREGFYTFDFPTWWKAERTATILSEHSGQPQAPGGALTANVESSTVMVNSMPDGADIAVDGKYVGSTPSTLRLSAGDHGVSVEKSGFKPWQRKVTLTAGSSPTISATLEKDFVTSPAANSTKPKDELRTTEGSPSAISDLSGSYAGEVRNTTLGVSAPFAIDLREENGGIYGCTTVQQPLVGSGGFQGTVNGSKIVFEATGKKLRIRFIGEFQGDALKGSYTVFPTQQQGNFQLRRVDSKAPAIGFNPAECRKD